MTLPQITLDAPTLKLVLSIVSGLLVLAMTRIVFLLRTNSTLRTAAAKMEKQVLDQHSAILSVRQDSNAWRGEMQRLFDAFRAEFSKRLSESEARYQDIQRRGQTPEVAPPPAPVANPFTAPAPAPLPIPVPLAVSMPPPSDPLPAIGLT